MQTKSALSSARRDDVTGFGVRSGTKCPNEPSTFDDWNRPRDPWPPRGSEFRAALEHVVGPQKQIEIDCRRSG